jgi:hypothetical protein
VLGPACGAGSLAPVKPPERPPDVSRIRSHLLRTCAASPLISSSLIVKCVRIRPQNPIFFSRQNSA